MTECDTVGYAASSLVLITFAMKDMLQLRIVAMCSNVAFIAYGVSLGLPPVVVLHAILLPMNGWRLWQVLSRTSDSSESKIEHSRTVLVIGRAPTNTIHLRRSWRDLRPVC
jgi:hypothetical protein